MPGAITQQGSCPPTRRRSKDIGDIGVARIIARLVELGRVVSIPFGDNARYDLVVETDGRLLRIQCKTGRLRSGAIVFPVSSSAAHRGRGRRSYHGEVDAFGIHCPDTAQVLLVPFVAVATCRREARLRVSASLNGQRRGIRTAAPFVL